MRSRAQKMHGCSICAWLGSLPCCAAPQQCSVRDLWHCGQLLGCCLSESWVCDKLEQACLVVAELHLYMLAHKLQPLRLATACKSSQHGHPRQQSCLIEMIPQIDLSSLQADCQLRHLHMQCWVQGQSKLLHTFSCQSCEQIQVQIQHDVQWPANSGGSVPRSHSPAQSAAQAPQPAQPQGTGSLLQLKSSACLFEELFVTHYYSHLHAVCVAARSLQA